MILCNGPMGQLSKDPRIQYLVFFQRTIGIVKLGGKYVILGCLAPWAGNVVCIDQLKVLRQNILQRDTLRISRSSEHCTMNKQRLPKRVSLPAGLRVSCIFDAVAVFNAKP